MSDWRQIGNQGLEDAKADINEWPWYAKFGLPVLGLGIMGAIAVSAVTGVWDSVTTTRTLNAQQMEIVKAEASRTAAAFTEQVDGRSVSGQLLSCSNTDSDKKGSTGFGKVTCTARVPQVKLNNKPDGTQLASVLFVERNMDCGIPDKSTTGCKFKQ